MTSINSDALKGQQSRIMNALRDMTQPQNYTPSGYDIQRSIANQIQGKGNYFDNMANISQQNMKTNLDAEQGIYNVMKEQAAMGDAEIKAVDEAIKTVAGDDPTLYTSILKDLHNDPEKVNSSNVKSKVMKYAAERGINPLIVQKSQAEITKLQAEAEKAKKGGDKPSLVQTAEAYLSGSKELRDTMDKFGKVYEKNTYRDENGNLRLLPGAADALKEQEFSKGYGKERGKFVASSKNDLPRVEDTANTMLQLIDELDKHPGLPYAIGASSKLPIIPGTDAADFMARLDQVKGGNFLQAYQILKGAGQITEIEGAKGENAIARLQRAQSEPAFHTALKDLKDVINLGVNRARKNAGVSSYSESSSNESPELADQRIRRDTSKAIDYKEFFK